MPLFGKKKTTEEVAKEVNVKLREVVGKYAAGAITEQQTEAEFYRILKHEFPHQLFAIPEANRIVRDHSGMTFEASNCFSDMFVATTHRLLTEIRKS